MKPTSRLKLGLATAFGLTCAVVIPFAGNQIFAQMVTPQPAVSQQNQSVLQAVPLAPNQIASQKLFQARKALATRDVATAQRLAAEVQAMRLQYAANDDRPELVNNLIEEYGRIVELGRTSNNSELFRRQYALFMVRQGDVMLRNGEFYLAQQLAQEAANQRVAFNQAEHESGLAPSVLLRRIDDARRAWQLKNQQVAVQMPQQPVSQATQMQLANAQNTLRQARAAMLAGHFDRAEQFCRAAKEYNVPETVFPAGSDTPERMLAEISLRRQDMAAQPQPVRIAPSQPVGTNAVANPQNQIIQTSGGQPTFAPPIPAPVLRNNAPTLVDQTVRNREAIISQISADIMQQISDAQRLSQEQRKPEAALDILQNAKARVDASALDKDTKIMFVRQIDKAIEETANFMDRYSAQAKQDQINKAVLAERRREADQFRSKEERLQTWINDCNKLIDQGRYEEAIMIAKKAKEFAPDEPATHLLLTTTQLVYNATRSSEVREKKAEGFVNAMLGTEDASIMPDFDKNPLHYATNWNDLTKRRRATNAAAEYQRPESEKKILRDLEMPVSANIDRPLSLEQALQKLCGQAGIPMYLDETALKESEITSGTMVRVPLAHEVKLKSALNIVLDQLGLTYVVKNEMLNITTKKRAKSELYPKTYYVGDIINNFPNLNPMDSNGNALEDAYIKGWNLQVPKSRSRTRGNNGGIQDEITAANLNDSNYQQVSARGGQVAFGQVDSGSSRRSGRSDSGNGSNNGFGNNGGYGSSSIDDIIDLIVEIIEPDSWEDAPEPTSFNQDKMIVCQTEEIHGKIEDLLSQLRKMNDLQIAVEVRYITLSDSFFEVMGLDFDMNFRNDKALGRMSSTTVTPTNADGTPGTAQTITKGNRVAIGLSQPNTFTTDASVPMFQNSFDIALSPMYGAAQPAIGLQTGFALLSDIEAYFFLAAAQGDERSSVLTAPKVMIYNGQSGTVNDTITTPYVTSVNPVVGDFSVGYQPVISLLTQGQLLTVHASVSNDRQHVRMTLNPSFTMITKEQTFKYFGDEEDTEETEDSTLSALSDDIASVETGNTNADARNSKKKKRTQKTSGITLQQPTVSSFYVQATVNCPDGGTAVLGGIKRLAEGRREGGTPILNKIPYIQRLFSNTSIGRDTKTMMMMVTPRIIIQEEEEEFIMGKSVK